MRVIVALVLFLAAASARTPMDIKIPVEKLNPRLTFPEWQDILANLEPKQEKVANYKPGTVRQIDGAGAQRGGFNGERIVGGSAAEVGMFPWQVSNTMDNSFFCGGSIISNTWVLTAAHCVDGFGTWALVFGSTNIDGGGTGSSSQTSRFAIRHEDYNDLTITNDVAVIGISALTFNVATGPVRLPTRSMIANTFAGETLRVSGWGRTSDSSGVSTFLNFVELPALSNADCAVVYGAIIVDSTICCSGENGRSTCNGDSGGPLVWKDPDNGLFTEVGVVSFGSSSGCTQGFPVGFARVTSFLDWIETNTGIIIEP